MDRMAEGYAELVKRIVAWASNEPNVTAAVVIGSRARVDHPADDWADLDVIVVADDPAAYLSSPDWITRIGSTWLSFVEPSGDGRTLERRVMFEGGYDVDFALLPRSFLEQMLQAGLPDDVTSIFRRGVQVILDKEGLAGRVLAAPEGREEAPALVAEGEFLNIVNDFWYHAVWSAKHLRRGELWWAKSGLDMHLKELLRRMMEWHARAMRGPEVDTWLRGRFLEEWADPRALHELAEAFARYEQEDMWRALFVTMDLFRWLSVETALRLGFTYPREGAEQAAELVRRMNVERLGSQV